MKSIILSISILISISIYAQTNNTIVIGKGDSVYSTILQENRKIWIHMPDTTSPDGIFAKHHYPVVYLLDGDENNFTTVASMIQAAGGGGGNISFPQMIVVGIPNTDRTRDLTPTHVNAAPMLDSMSAAHSGGGENFISFIQKYINCASQVLTPLPFSCIKPCYYKFITFFRKISVFFKHSQYISL